MSCKITHVPACQKIDAVIQDVASVSPTLYFGLWDEHNL